MPARGAAHTTTPRFTPVRESWGLREGSGVKGAAHKREAGPVKVTFAPFTAHPPCTLPTTSADDAFWDRGYWDRRFAGGEPLGYDWCGAAARGVSGGSPEGAGWETRACDMGQPRERPGSAHQDGMQNCMDRQTFG
jgi:hypothetical protein